MAEQLVIGRSYTFPANAGFDGFNNDLPVCVLRVNEAGTMIDGLTSSALVTNVDVSGSAPVPWAGPCVIQDGKTTFPTGAPAPVALEFPRNMLFSFDLVWLNCRGWDGLRPNYALPGHKTVRVFARTQSALDALKATWEEQSTGDKVYEATPVVTQPWPFFHREPVTRQRLGAAGNPEAVAEDALAELDRGVVSAYDAARAVKLGQLKFAPVYTAAFGWPYSTNVGHVDTVALYGVN